MRWNDTTPNTKGSKEEFPNDDIRNGLPSTHSPVRAHYGMAVQDRPRTTGAGVTNMKSKDTEESIIASWLCSRHSKPVSLELGFVAIWIGLGFVAVVGTLLGIGETNP